MTESNKEHVATVGERIRILREAIGLMQKEFAASIGVASSYLSSIENDKAKPSFKFLLKLHRGTKVNMEYIFTGKPPMFRKDEPEPNGGFDIDKMREIENTEQLLWVMKFSATFRNTIFGFASKFFLDNAKRLRETIKEKTKPGGK